MEGRVAQKVEYFFSDYPVRNYKAGQILLHAHDNPEHVFHLLEGRVKQYDITDRGDEVVLNVFKPPAFFPMTYAINKTPNTYFFEAESDTVLNICPIDEATNFLRTNPDVLYDLLARVYRGTDGLLGRMAHLMRGSARSRVMFELLIEARRFGHRRGRGAIIQLSEGDIAARVGLARETVSREIGKLKTDNLISVIKGGIYINDLEHLAAVVGHDL